MDYTVSEVARLTGVSVRALHHYDERGLLKPSARSAAGYRLYGEADLARLQQVLFFRELGFGLEEIARILDDPGFDRREALKMQRRLLAERKGQLASMIRAVDAALDAMERGTTMDLKAMFDGFDPGQYEEEVKQRWGDTDAYKESARRTKGYTKRDWEQIKREGCEVTQRLADLMAQGKDPGDPAVQQAVEAQRLYFDRWFYPCSRQMHRSLGEMYVADPRFTATYEKIKVGLAQFICDATRLADERG